MDWIEKQGPPFHRHPWELSRADSLLSLLQNFPSDYSYADVGAGDLFFSERLARMTPQAIVAVDQAFADVTPVGTIHRFRRLEDVPAESADGLLLLDVLEHVKEDQAFFQSALRVLKRGGRVVVTVPAHPFLFSEHDVFLRHYRRYRKKTLLPLLQSGPVVVQECFYFYTSLFLARCLQKVKELMFRPRVESSGVGGWRYKEEHLWTRMIRTVLNGDFFLNRTLSAWGLGLTGLSLCVIARKK